MPELSIFLFGYPRLECDGTTVPIRRRKALALLSYLATTGSSHSRDTLAALLWPEHEASRAFSFLRNALWILNGTPLSDWLVSSRHTIGLRANPDLMIDVGEFRRALSLCHDRESTDCVERLVRATELFQHDFLAGFSVEDSEPYEDWQYSESSALRHELGTALDHLSRVSERSARPNDAIRFVRRWLDIQPLNEAVHRRLMELLAGAGQRAEALSQYDQCRETLKRELGLAPSEETTSLANRIRRTEATPEPVRYAPKPVPVNFPSYRTAFVGREDELAKAVALLRDDDCHLLTITGPGGCGKTRLAIETAAQSTDSFPDGIAYIPLVATESSSDVPLEIADVLGAYSVSDAIDEGGEAGPVPGLFSDLLLARLKPQKMLLVLDNLEHLLVDLRWIDTLLERAPGIKLLVTSRHQLNLKDEWVLPLEGLPFPRGSLPPDDLANLDSVALFAQSAKRANASFTPTDEDWRAISQIAELLEGMPLGIELAAAWVRTTSCEAIAEEIGKSLDFLSTSLRDVPKRHHSLRAVFEQSWRLLSREGRTAFRRLAVFRSGFTREAALHVASATVPAVSGLVARSLLRPTSPDRTEMLEVLRQFAEERLRALPEESKRIQDAHAGYYLSLLAEQEEALKGSEQKQASELLLEDIDNVRAAWRWAAARCQTERLDRAAFGLFLFCDMRNHFDEGARLFSEAAACVAEDMTNQGRLLFGLLRGLEAWFTGMRYRETEARSLFEESLATLEKAGMGRELALINVLSAFGGYASDEEGDTRLRGSLEFFRETHARWGEAEVLEALAWRLLRSDSKEAIAHASEAVRIHEELGDPWGVAMAKFTLGSLYTATEDYERAKIEVEESLALRRGNDLDPLGAMQCIASLGYLANQAGDLAEASRRYREALAIAEETGARWAQALTHESLVSSLSAIGDNTPATYHAKAAISIYRSLGHETAAVRCQTLLDTIGAS